MPRGLRNWSAAAVIRFLRKRRFVYAYTRGSHFYYRSGRAHLVCVPIHGKSGVIHPKTLKGIIRQSGIPEKEWLANE